MRDAMMTLIDKINVDFVLPQNLYAPVTNFVILHGSKFWCAALACSAELNSFVTIQLNPINAIGYDKIEPNDEKVDFLVERLRVHLKFFHKEVDVTEPQQLNPDGIYDPFAP